MSGQSRLGGIGTCRWRLGCLVGGRKMFGRACRRVAEKGRLTTVASLQLKRKLLRASEAVAS